MTDEENGWPGHFCPLRDTLPAEDRALLRRSRLFITSTVGRALTGHGAFV